MASDSKVVVEWPVRENGAETIYTAIIKVGFLSFDAKDEINVPIALSAFRDKLSFEMCFKVFYRSTWAWSCKKVVEWTPYDVKQIQSNKLIK